MLRLWPLAVLLAGVGCNRSKLTEDEAVMMKFKERVCSCRDRACADPVVAEALAWSGSGAPRKLTPRMEEILQALISCSYEANAKTPVAAPPAMLSGSPTAEQLIESARDHASQVVPNLGIYAIEASPVRSDGSLVADRGSLSIAFMPKPGTPSPGPDACPRWIAEGRAWRAERGSCAFETRGLEPQRCTLRAIWDKALLDAKPPSKDALATLRLIGDPDDESKQTWAFVIEPETIANRFYPDDCP